MASPLETEKEVLVFKGGVYLAVKQEKSSIMEFYDLPL